MERDFYTNRLDKAKVIALIFRKCSWLDAKKIPTQPRANTKRKKNTKTIGKTSPIILF